MDIEAKITGIEYVCKLSPKLPGVEMNDFDINQLPASAVVNDGGFSFGLSKWVSPKRTRSYPYARIYNTLGHSKKITVIPIIKDEGKNGDRDFIQWDTVSLMSLLDVFVVFAYYNRAENHPTRPHKITGEAFDTSWVRQKIMEIKAYHSSALHWNLKEVAHTFPYLIEQAKKAFRSFHKNLNVEFHSEKGIDLFAGQFQQGVTAFMNASREKARAAQNREIQTLQPKEALMSATKATLTIENYLGGQYHLTTDEVKINDNSVWLMENKHSKTALLPGTGDIKDGLLKMILYTNLQGVTINERTYTPKPVLQLTSDRLTGRTDSAQTDTAFRRFISAHDFTKKQTDTLERLMSEARANGFTVNIQPTKP